MRFKYTDGPWHVEPVTDENGEQFYDEDLAGGNVFVFVIQQQNAQQQQLLIGLTRLTRT